MAAPTAAHIRPSGAAARVVPFLVVAGSVSIVAHYVGSQLSRSRNVMDSRFAQYNSTQSEAQRRRTFEGNTHLDPRTSLFNILGH
ncbi:uncharacterized protein F5Z01DRAFT_646498 [Emericellopsis atlantica]|uniref:Uncharacterized protein n=1 Tax=Emericellopsis atlantica TaxID=2614577 RepID=A0A9P7ZTX9_9HYPO|nr:uncharacterized protein F5Z01DRAFT_646498 [Emericellopsis atlantica]KAG9257615.1 hypothetical protein F5Z01DRAFT_646498 [Emericellopsis atlantica]